MTHRVLAFFTILGAVPILFRLYASGTISLHLAGMAMGILILSLLIGRKVAKVVLPIFGVAILAAEYTQGNPSQFAGALTALFALGIALYGVYIMLSGVFRSEKTNDKP